MHRADSFAARRARRREHNITENAFGSGVSEPSLPTNKIVFCISDGT